MILEISNIRFSYTDTWNEKSNLLNGVSLSVEDGTVTAIVGGNGAGKTSLFNIISGFQEGYSGEILFDGKSLNGLPPSVISRMGIGRLFQGGQLLDGLSLIENLKLASDDRTGENPIWSLIYPKKVHGREESKEKRAKEVLAALFGNDCKYLDMLDKNASSFSYGEQRLLSFACLFMGDRRLLLLDEPTSGVNPVVADAIGRIIREKVTGSGLSVLMIEHNMQFVRKVADRCAFLDDGIISTVGPVDAVLDDRRVRNSYLGL